VPVGGPLGDTVTIHLEFLDIGSVPWERRPESSRLLAELKRSDRGRPGVVVGESTHRWFGNQFYADESARRHE
jgi:hypothetical protein